MPRILLFSTTTGYQLRSFNDAAARLGVDLVFATDRCHALDDPWQDAALPVRFHDEAGSLELVVSAAREQPFDGIVVVGDRPTLLAARAAQALGLPGNPAEAVLAASSKLGSRERFARAGLAAPWFLVVPEGISAEAAARDARLHYPCVVKPTSLSGSRGVIRADTPEQCAAAIQRIRRLLGRPSIRELRHPDGEQIIVEGFIEGREYAIEGVMSEGRVRALAIFDKPDPLDGPFFEETIFVTPASPGEAEQQAIVSTVQQGATALGLRHGAIHAECRVKGARVVMLEIAPRPIGGLCSRVLRLVPTGGTRDDRITLEELLLRHALGEDLAGWEREPDAAAVMMIPIPRLGVFKAVEGEEASRATAYVEEVRVTAKRDQLLEPLPEAGSYLGFIFARATLPKEAEQAVREAHSHLSFAIDPAIAVTPG
jgi:biotin carboxylase